MKFNENNLRKYPTQIEVHGGAWPRKGREDCGRSFNARIKPFNLPDCNDHKITDSPKNSSVWPRCAGSLMNECV